MSLKIENASKGFDEILFEKLDLEVEKGEIVALLGNSGCGKSTLLRIICGLENLDDGQIFLAGQKHHANSSIKKENWNDIPKASPLSTFVC